MQIVLVVIEDRAEAEERGEATSVQFAGALVALSSGGELPSSELCAAHECLPQCALGPMRLSALFGRIGILELEHLRDALAQGRQARTEQPVVHARAGIQSARRGSQLDRCLAAVKLGVDIVTQTARMVGARDEPLPISDAPWLSPLGLVLCADLVQDRERLLAVAAQKQGLGKSSINFPISEMRERPFAPCRAARRRDIRRRSCCQVMLDRDYHCAVHGPGAPRAKRRPRGQIDAHSRRAHVADRREIADSPWPES